MVALTLTIITPNLATQTKWKTDHELFGSDHFPIHINLFDNDNSSKSYKVPRYKLETTIGPLFTSLTKIFHNKRPPSHQINQEAANIIKIIHRSVSRAIPQSNSVFNKKKTVPWWNRSLEQLRTNKNQSWYLLRRNIPLENIIQFKKNKALFRREMKQAKRSSLQKFTTPSKIWTNNNTFCGRKTRNDIHCITSPTTPSINIINSEPIAQVLVTHWSESSSDSKFTESFQTNKNRVYLMNLTHNPSPEPLLIESKITLIEFKAA